MVSLTLRFNPHSSEFSQNDLCFFSSSGRQWPQCIEREWFGTAALQRRRTLPSRRRRHADEAGDARPARADDPHGAGTDCVGLSLRDGLAQLMHIERRARSISLLRPIKAPTASVGASPRERPCTRTAGLLSCAEPTSATAAASSRASSSALRRSAAARSRRPCGIGEIGCHRHQKQNTAGIGSGAAANLAVDATCETMSAGS